MATTDTRVQQLQELREKAFKGAHTIAERASREKRYLTDLERLQYDSHVANLDHATKEQKSLLAGACSGGRNPQQALVQLESKRNPSMSMSQPTPLNVVRQQRVDLEKARNEELGDALDAHERTMQRHDRRRQLEVLDEHLSAAEAHERHKIRTETLNRRQWVADNMPAPSENS
jgi:hypothetical protein